jgi:excisionase family DNA binding protein
MLSNSNLSAGNASTAAQPAPAPMMTPLAYTIDDVVKYTRVGRTKVFEAIREGKLRAVKNGKRTLVLSDDLYQWLGSLSAIEPRSERTG